MKNEEVKVGFVNYALLLFIASYLLTTFYFMSFFQIGWVIIIFSIFVTLITIYLKRSNWKGQLSLAFVVCLLIVLLFFYLFRLNLPDPSLFFSAQETNFGSAGLSFVAVWLTPFFILLAILSYFLNKSVSK